MKRTGDKVWRQLLAVMGGFSLYLSAAAQGEGPLAVLEALPTAETLGPGWTREISILFDPASKPAELFAASSRLPDSFKVERREAVRNPTNRISGWSHTHFTVKSATVTRSYDVQIERYRSKEWLRANFERLLAFDSEDYRKVSIDGVGDAAVFYRNLKGGATVWFRRGDFMVWVAPIGSGTDWAQDGQLQHLTRLLDQRIKGVLPRAMEPSQSKK